jgi:lipopolysaccharide transport system permease protein
MSDIHYSAASELRDPGRFLTEAIADLRLSCGIAWQLFRSNMRARYRRSWLGYTWLLLPSLATVIICMLIRSSRVVTVGTTELPYPLFVLVGVILWQAFTDGLNAPLDHLGAARQIITRSRVPHEAVVLAGVIEVGLNSLVRLAALATAFALFDLPLRWSMLGIPLGFMALSVLGLAFGMILAPLGLLYDDVRRTVVIGTGLWFFLTPVVYPAPAQPILPLNPVAPILQATRSLMTSSDIGLRPYAVAVAAAIALVFAWLLYRVARRHVIARLG